MGMVISIGQAWPADESARPAITVSVEKAREAGASTSHDVVTLNFVNADIEGVVKVVSEITGKNFVLDPRMKVAINIVSAKPMPRSVVYHVFLSVLRLQGFAVIENLGIVKIVPEADVKLNPGTTFGPSEQARGAGDRIQTKILTQKYESAVQLVPILRPLISPTTSSPHTRTATRWRSATT